MCGFRRRSRRGSVLLISLFFVTMASVAAIGALGYVSSVHRMDERMIAREKALGAAEAGVYRLLSYFNEPSSMPSSCSTNEALVTDYFNGMDASTIAASGMTFINASTGLNTDLIVFDRARATRLTVGAPRANAPTGTVFTFSSVASCSLSFGGSVERTVQMDVAFATAPKMVVPAGIIAGGQVATNGHFNLRWGEAWSKGPLAMDFSYKSVNNHPEQWDYTGGNNQVNHGDDQWVGYRTSNYITDKNGTPLVNDATVNNVGARNKDLDTDYLSILYQNSDAFTPAGQQTLSQKIDAVIDNYAKTGDTLKGYEAWKLAAIRRDTYFRPSGGAVYNSGGQQLYLGGDGTLNTTGSGSALTAVSAMEYYRGLSTPYVAFFDTSNGQPPVDDKSNWTNISYTGSISNHSHGLLYVAGDLNVGGSGQPPSETIANPAQVQNDQNGTTSQNVFHDGVIFTWGDFNYQGNGITYGAIVTKGSYLAGGNPYVYYNESLKSADSPPLSSRPQVLAVVIG